MHSGSSLRTGKVGGSGERELLEAVPRETHREIRRAASDDPYEKLMLSALEIHPPDFRPTDRGYERVRWYLGVDLHAGGNAPKCIVAAQRRDARTAGSKGCALIPVHRWYDRCDMGDVKTASDAAISYRQW